MCLDNVASSSKLVQLEMQVALANAEVMNLKGFCYHCLKTALRASKFLNPIFER